MAGLRLQFPYPSNALEILLSFRIIEENRGLMTNEVDAKFWGHQTESEAKSGRLAWDYWIDH